MQPCSPAAPECDRIVHCNTGQFRTSSNSAVQPNAAQPGKIIHQCRRAQHSSRSSCSSAANAAQLQYIIQPCSPVQHNRAPEHQQSSGNIMKPSRVSITNTNAGLYFSCPVFTQLLKIPFNGAAVTMMCWGSFPAASVIASGTLEDCLLVIIT